MLIEMEQEFPEEFACTRASAFRSATDISVTNSLYHYYALMTGRAVQQENARFATSTPPPTRAWTCWRNCGNTASTTSSV
ncbi:exopolysaccharide phosphotransferase CpsY domain protein [Mycobacterium kansasii]|uniref:Exopolysaccharide phosphotransferase CpsY domain protein n=1 Tax=Mycobacterium kansasii TaxID=1768 RepID=A0A1V3WU28_MYCKA|nr:exopolysaccharide phosphotransferase CpsY domain protein [Mycobacterium kansasii]